MKGSPPFSLLQHNNLIFQKMSGAREEGEKKRETQYPHSSSKQKRENEREREREREREELQMQCSQVNAELIWPSIAFGMAEIA